MGVVAGSWRSIHGRCRGVPVRRRSGDREIGEQPLAVDLAWVAVIKTTIPLRSIKI